jgi:hypothetical protein
MKWNEKVNSSIWEYLKVQRARGGWYINGEHEYLSGPGYDEEYDFFNLLGKCGWELAASFVVAKSVDDLAIGREGNPSYRFLFKRQRQTI